MMTASATTAHYFGTRTILLHHCYFLLIVDICVLGIETCKSKHDIYIILTSVFNDIIQNKFILRVLFNR